MLNTYFKSSYFVFNGGYYKQCELQLNLHGQNWSCIVFFCCVEKKLNFTTPLLKFYVDDSIVLIPTNRVQHILNVFNSVHTKIKSTLEMKTNERVPFLDKVVMREHTNLICDWYMKPYYSGRCINFCSNYSLQQKVNVIRNQIFRATTLSNTKFHIQNV